MAGHSKWANIKHRKAAQDKKRGKVFTRLIRELTVATREGGGADPGSNPRLRAAIDEANGMNMPKDTMTRAIKRGSGELGGEDVVEILYEGYGPGGIAVMVDCLTDNRNRTVGTVRHAFTKCGGNLGTDGSVAYLFTKQGLITFAPGCDEDKIMELALEAGADDVVSQDDGSIEVLTTPETFLAVKQVMLDNQLSAETAELTQIAAMQVELDKKGAEKMLRLIDMLEELDDVQDVFCNAQISDEILQELGD